MSLDVRPVLREIDERRREHPGMHTATMSLVVFFEEASLAPWIRDRGRAVAWKHTSRVIVFDATRPEGDQEATESSSHGEWVEVGVKGSSSAELASALSALALAEAPIVLTWLAQGLADDERFSILAALSHTVICSSSLLDVGTAGVRDLANFIRRHPDFNVQDLAYVRLASWRESIADFFDEPELMAELHDLREVEVGAGSDAEAYYLVGWLASRLGWTPCAANQFCNRNGATITFTIQRTGAPRRLESVVLRSPATAFSARVLAHDEAAVCLEVTGEKHRERRSAPLVGIDIVSLVERTILSRRPDAVFHETLAMAEQLIERRNG